MLIFPRVRENDRLTHGAPIGTLSAFNKKGYMTKVEFISWLNHFIIYSKPSQQNRVLLIVDGHSTHIKNIEAIEIAIHNNIDILCLPAHTSYRLQPLDVAFMGPFKTYCNKEINIIVKKNTTCWTI